MAPGPGACTGSAALDVHLAAEGAEKAVRLRGRRRAGGRQPQLQRLAEGAGADAQDDILGKAKGKAYREGGYKADVFTNDRGRTPTLKEMAARDARAFKQPQGEFTIYDPGFTRVGPDISTPARATAVQMEKAIRNEANEFGAFFDADGKVLLKRSGLPDRVTYFEDELSQHAGGVVHTTTRAVYRSRSTTSKLPRSRSFQSYAP
jgi:hypothetical protein